MVRWVEGGLEVEVTCLSVSRGRAGRGWMSGSLVDTLNESILFLLFVSFLLLFLPQ